MANRTLFSSATSNTPRADARNEAGGRAYQLPAKHALAQLAATGCFNGTYYASGESQLQTLLDLAAKVEDNSFLAKLALYSRRHAFMKDMPAALLLILSKRDTELFHTVFHRVIDNGRVLRTLFQMLRSGQFGRKSLSASLQRAFQLWLNEASVEKLLSASIGNNPSLRDVLRMARPTPKNNARRALFGWLTGKEQWAPATFADLPEQVRALIAYRQSTDEDEQVAILSQYHFRWDLLADAAAGPKVWKALTHQMGLQALRMNLNTLMRHEVFNDESMVASVAERLGSEQEVQRARQFPYQFLAASINAQEDLPLRIRHALGRAAETACGSIPELPGPVVIGVDVSGSMGCAATGYRGRGATSKVRCVDVAALFAAALVRRNPGSLIIPFDDRAHAMTLRTDQPILRFAEQLAQYGGGGTDCSLPLKTANETHAKQAFAGCVLISDNQSWIGHGYCDSTKVMTEWKRFVNNQRMLQGKGSKPKLVCVDIQPYTTSQAPDRKDILNVGGFSDAVFRVVSAFLSEDAGRFVSEVEAVEL